MWSAEGYDFSKGETGFRSFCETYPYKDLTVPFEADSTAPLPEFEELTMVLSDCGFSWKLVKPLCKFLESQRSRITGLDVSDSNLGHFDGLSMLLDYLSQVPYPTIHELNLTSNEIEEEGVLLLSEKLIDNDQLRRLVLDSNCRFSSVSTHAIGNLVINSVTLTELSLADLQIDAHGAQVLCESVMHNDTLTSLNLDMNVIGYEGGGYLGEMLSVNKGLQRLSIAANRLNADGFADMLGFDAVSRNTSLTSLNVSRNFIQGIDQIAGIFKDLVILNIAYNNVNVPGAVKICRHLENPDSKLQLLYLQRNLIGDDGVCVLADALNHNTVLKIIDLSENMISIQGVMYLTSMLCTNTTLQKLTLNDNSFGNEAVSLLYGAQEQMWGLRYLEVRRCKVTDYKRQASWNEGKICAVFDDSDDETVEVENNDE